MKKAMLFIVFSAVFFTVYLLSIAHAQEEYPTRPVEIICPFPPGGMVDLTMRALVSVAGQYLGQPLVPINRSGGGGAVGAAFVAKAKADGDTILIASSTSILTKPLVEKLPYKGEDFIFIGRIIAVPEIICVLSTSPWKTLKEFIEEAKKNPGKFRYASGGTYNPEHILYTSLSQMAGIELIHIPTGGGGPNLTMFLGGHVETSSFFPPVIRPHIAAGTVRPLAVNSPERLEVAEIKGIPTLKELGFATQNFFWVGVFAPKGTPQPIVKKLRTVVKQTCEDKVFVQYITNMGIEVRYMGGEDFEKFFKEQQHNLFDLLKSMK